MIQNMNKAIITIKTTMSNHQKSSAVFPYFFIVGAGISAPEIPTSNTIIEQCKKKVKDISQENYQECKEETEDYINDPITYYSSWIQYAFPNRIDRSNYFKELIKKSKISSANLMLAQILNSKSFANTVFTTNFDDSIKKALELMGTDDFFVAENVMDNLAVNNQTKDIQIVHVHGTYNFYDCANLKSEIDNVASQSGIISSYRLLSSFLSNQAPIVVGYSGWENDVIMTCLKERLSQPTPLQFIWVCYDIDSFRRLPDWLKNSDSINFVVPEKDLPDCKDEKDSVGFLEKNENTFKNDATTFFRRIKAEFNIASPTIFSDPYSYYSERFDKLLPVHEDVLHLRYWTKRMKVLNSNDDEFEKHFKILEKIFIKKDYIEASRELNLLKDIQLSETDVEFLCSSLIKDFILAESVAPLNQRITFHSSVVDFIENQLNSFPDEKSLIDSLIWTMNIDISSFEEAQKLTPIFDRVLDIASKDKRLLEIELLALSKKAPLSEEEEAIKCWEEIIEKSPKTTKVKRILDIRFTALAQYSLLVEPENSEKLIKESEKILKEINNEFNRIILIRSKAILLFKIHTKRTQKKWAVDILNLLSSQNKKIDLFLYIDIADDLLNSDISDLSSVFDVDELIKILIQLIDDYEPHADNFQAIIDYIRCCYFICNNTDYDSIVSKYCKRIIDLQECFNQKTKIYIYYLYFSLLIYLQLPSTIVSDTEKNAQLLKVKNNEVYESVFYDVLENAWYFEFDYINSIPILKESISIVENDSSVLQEGYDCYCAGDKIKAENNFKSIINSKCERVAQTAIGNLMFMSRRGETECDVSFWDLVNKLDRWNSTALMNILLYCINYNEHEREEFTKAKNDFYNLSDEEIKDVVEWWEQVDLIGEEESKLALAIVNGSLKD